MKPGQQIVDSSNAFPVIVFHPFSLGCLLVFLARYWKHPGGPDNCQVELWYLPRRKQLRWHSPISRDSICCSSVSRFSTLDHLAHSLTRQFIRVGNLRFAAPQDPISFEGVRQATHYGAACPQAAFGGGPGGPPTINDSEDCESIEFSPCEYIRRSNHPGLFVNVVKPANIAPEKKLPVLFVRCLQKVLPI